MFCGKRLVPLVILALLGGSAAASELAPSPTPFDLKKHLGTRWYGIYLVGQKIGYAEAEIRQAYYKGEPAVTVSLRLHARVKMLGTPQDLTISERRIYLIGGGLVSFVTSTEAAGSATRISGEIRDGMMHLTSAVGGRERSSVTEVPLERFEDYLAEGLLVKRDAKVGDEISFTQYQPTMGKSITAVSRIKEISDKPMQGVLSRLYVIETTISEMGITTESVVKDDGEVLESQIGSGFTMRLEDEKTAKNIDYRSDVLLSTVIKPKEPIKDPTAVRQMKVRLSGVRDRSLLISSERQSYTVDKGGEAVLVVKVEDLAGTKIPDIPMDRAAFPDELSPSLMIQSDSPEIIALAKRIVGEERNALKASDRIVKWVHSNLKKQFSASFSNALDVVSAGGGDCTEHSVLYVAIARAAGLPAREVSGIVYTDEDASFYYHQWAEVYVGKWIAVDPTFGETQADATHIMFAQGDILSQARLLNLIGALKIDLIEYGYETK